MPGPVGLLAATLTIVATPWLPQELQPGEVQETRELLQTVKHSDRGPFARIRWYCQDGTVLPPRPNACQGHGGGVQHGEPSAAARRLAERGYHVATLFVSLDYQEYLDADDNYYRPREIVLQDYLQRVDDGWVYRNARTYRGSRQAEDEEIAGRRLLSELLADTAWVRDHFLLAVEAVRAVPHGREPARRERIRDLARRLGDANADFQPIRARIHSYPGPGDTLAVARFRDSHPALPTGQRARLDSLLATLRAYYGTGPRERARSLLDEPPFRNAAWRGRLLRLLEATRDSPPADLLAELAVLNGRLRREVEGSTDGEHNLRRLDLGLLLHELLVREASVVSFASDDSGPTQTTRFQALRQARAMLLGAYGRGLLSRRELRAQLERYGAMLGERETTALEYRRGVAYLQRSVLWAQRTVEASFGEIVDRYRQIEPLAAGFHDDLLRSTVLLTLAAVTDRLGWDAKHQMGLTDVVFGQVRGAALYGLNPGVASGVLDFVPEDSLARAAFQRDRIYVLPESYPQLPPVAGVLTLSEGSSLSHLQLLARSLGIPNAVIPPGNMKVVRPHIGQEVLYAVSPFGAVVLKETSNLTPKEQALLAESRGMPERRVSIDASRLDLSERRVRSLEELQPDDAERLVGPKAVGVAWLHREFPDRVAPGLVVPFGAFRAHLAGHGPEERDLYAELVAFYGRVEELERQGRPESEVDAFIEVRLSYFRREINQRALHPDLVRQLRARLDEWGPRGSFGVFVRSDTNVEDLAGFSGAGLNLTVPNRIRFEDILSAIKRVWASPFTRRAFGWRRSVIDTPEHTYVSVLLQKSVPADVSGVLVTADLETAREGYATVSAAEGIGGVVSGEMAESLLVPLEGGEPILLAQSRAPYRQRPRMRGAGGIVREPTSTSEYVLSPQQVAQLAKLARRLERDLEPPADDAEQVGAWDVEFGFVGDHLWLFQIRPLASDPRTRSMSRLVALDAGVKERADRPVDLREPIS